MKLAILLGLATLVVGSYGKRLICYYGTWSVYRVGPAKFDVEDIDPKLCTHVMYAFVGLNDNGTVRLLDRYNDVGDGWKEGAIFKMQKLRRLNPNVKIQFAIGGWTEGSTLYSQVVNDPIRRKVLVNSILDFTIKYNFDGFDIDWEYPADRGGRPSDREAFTLLLKEIKEVFKPRQFILSAAVSANALNCPRSYNCKDIVKYLDFINVMTYDLHGSWDNVVGHHTALYPHPNDSPFQKHLNVDTAMRYWVDCTGQPEKLNIGLAAYGRTFILADPNNHQVGAPSTGPAPPGKYVPEFGFYGYNEICMEERKGSLKIYNITEQKVIYAVKKDIWVAYDNVNTILEKLKYAKNLKVEGASIWSIETDDFRGDCGSGKYPLLNAINKALNLKLDNKEPELPTVEPTPSDIDYSFMCKTCGQMFPHPTNPQAFFTCTFSGIDGSLKAVQGVCPAGLLYDPKLKVCNFPENCKF